METQLVEKVVQQKGYNSNKEYQVWIITAYWKNTIKMYEYDTKIEAKEAVHKLKGCKILTEVVYFDS